MNYADEHADGIARAAALIRDAHYAIALTGAGSSTPSGIPDFRSPGSGMWERVDPMEVASIYTFRRDPNRFYSWIRPMVTTLLMAEPNPGHLALAKLETGRWLKAIITQNIDNLYQRAGACEVLELHGHMREATCISCYRAVPARELMDDFLASDQVPRCAVCGGVMKPNVVLFGEQLPIEVVNAAMAHIRQSDLMLIAGSSLEVMPASQLPLLVHGQAGRLIVVNLTPTRIDDIAEVVIHADVAEVLPRIARACVGVE
ncbi:MAG: NAD-dependent deacylase [Chloroflexota bacterium]|nr:NAD-dependent deacylase [Chloroflexota bacterium]